MSINDLITDTRNAARPNSTTVSSSRSSGVLTLACTNLAGWPTTPKAVHFVTYQVDTNSKVVANTQVDWKGLVSGNNIGTLTLVDGIDNGNSVGDIVEMLPTAKWGQDLADALLVGHTRAGVHVSGLPLTSPVLTTPVIADLTSATHTHANAAGGGTLTGSTALINSTVTADKLSTGADEATVSTDQTTTSTSYTDLTTSGPARTVTIGANGLALVFLFAKFGQSTAGSRAYMGFGITGASTVAAADAFAVEYQSWTANSDEAYGATFLVKSLTPGSTTFTAKYRADANTARFILRRIAVVPL